MTTPYEMLDELMAAAGEEPAARHVKFHGADPVLPVPLRVGEGGAAVIAAGAVQAARLWEMKTGRMQSIEIPVDAAAVALKANFHLRREPVPGQIGPTVMDELRGQGGLGGGSRIMQAGDGRWMYLHRQFEHHRAAQDKLLNATDGPSLIEAVAKWDSQALEDAIFDHGSAGGMVRTYAEWNAHEQAKTLDLQPIVEVTKIGDSPPEPLPAGNRPLSGVRVLDVTRVIAGPTVARTLAEHGADVLRIATDKLPDNQAQSMDTGHGKLSTVLDLTTQAGVDQLKKLIGGADVFSQGYRPGSLAARGFSPEAVAAIRPGIIYSSLSAWSHEGPWRMRRGFDTVVCAVSGIADEYSEDGKPRLMSASAIDYSTGYLAAFGIMVALGRRAREGGSYIVRVALARTGRWITKVPHIGRETWSRMQADLPKERYEELMVSAETPFGRLRFLAPVAQMSETPARWERPTAPLNYNKPEWPER